MGVTRHKDVRTVTGCVRRANLFKGHAGASFVSAKGPAPSWSWSRLSPGSRRPRRGIILHWRDETWAEEAGMDVVVTRTKDDWQT